METRSMRPAIAAEVRAALARDGRRASDLALAVHMSPASLSRKLRGESPLYIEELIAIATALGVDAGALLPPSSAVASTAA